MKSVRTILTAGVAAAAIATPIPVAAEEPIAQAGDFLIRLRAIGILPKEGADITVIGGDVEIEDKWVPEIDFSYFVTNNIAFELIAASASHTVTAVDTAVGDVYLGEVRHIPPTLLVQYHQQGLGPVKPYVGVGVNYTIFLENDAPGINVDYDPSVGWAVQIGADYQLTERFFANIDLKYISISTDADLNTPVGAVRADVDINPVVAGFGVGVRF
ncbi:MAG: OmpW family outer membrane protein [Pseudomonadota bacterium]